MNKYIQSIGVYLLVILVYLIGKDNFLEIFDKTVLPHLSNLNFSVLTHIVFILICITICWRILIIYKRKYRISYISICYIILTLFIYTPLIVCVAFVRKFLTLYFNTFCALFIYYKRKILDF